MNIKDLFDNAENGVLNYEQFIAAATGANAKFTDLSEGGYVAKQKYTDELASRDTRINSLEDTVKTRDSDLESLKTQLANAGTDATKLTELTTKFADLQKQYDKDTKALQKQMDDNNYKHAVDAFANTQNFSSKAAKRDFVNALIGKQLKIEGETLIGATDFVSAYAQENEDAFVKETAKAEEKPHFAASTNQNSSGNDNNFADFNFGFTGVRPHEK